MDTNGGLGIMFHVGHLRTRPEFVRGLWVEKQFFGDRQIPENIMCYTCDIFSENYV